MRIADAEWLLQCGEPWTEYRTRIDLFDVHPDDPDVTSVRQGMLEHPSVTELMQYSATWPGYALKRHNDAKHPLQTLSVLADFGLNVLDPLMSQVADVLFEHLSAEGIFQTKIRLYKRFGGVDGEFWTWMMCDAPTIIYALASFGMSANPDVRESMQTLNNSLRDNGWPCQAGAPLNKSFKGPGRSEDPCPLANLLMLKANSAFDTSFSDFDPSPAIEMLLAHWNREFDRKLYLFGTGTDFARVKYPFVWYDILHVAEVLSRYPVVYSDVRYENLINRLKSAMDENGRVTAESMYMAWRGWSFADKKKPSPWLSFLVFRILKRRGEL
jgi:hypothetical protein